MIGRPNAKSSVNERLRC